MKKLDSKGIDRLPTGTKLFTIICLAWALIIVFVNLVYSVPDWIEKAKKGAGK